MANVEAQGDSMNVYKAQIQSIEGKPMSLEQFKGKVILAVNIATRCGYTKQLSGLEKIYQDYKDKGVVVLGVPSNDFGAQTPEDESEVKNFCMTRYGVTFPLTEKIQVKGNGKHPLAAALVGGAPTHDEIAWNFEKFIIDKNGKVIERFGSKVTPEDSKLKSAIEKAL